VNIRIEDINDTRKKLLVQVGADEVEKEHDELVKEFAKAARLPGFRPGRAPLPMVAKRFSREINEELTKKIVSKSYRQALEETKVTPFAMIDLPAPSVARGQESEVSFVLDVHPSFELPEYKGLEIKKPSEEVKEEDVDKAVLDVRNQRADFKKVEREAKKDDYVKLSYEGKLDGQLISDLLPEKPVFGTQSATWEEVGAEVSALPGLPSALEGLKAGEKKEIPVQFPEDFEEEALRGKTATYEVEIQEVRERELPELTEEFLKGLGVSSQEELRERIREDLERQKKADSRANQRQQIAEKLAASLDFALPESAVERETESILRQFLEANLRRGVQQEEFESRKEELHSGARQGALHRVKVQLILAKIAQAEKIQIDDKELSRYVYFEAMRRREKPEKMVRELRKNPDEVDSIRQGLLFDKVLDFLLEKATISESET
jgi:trigger factor